MPNQHTLPHSHEYTTVSEGAGWMDKRPRGRLRFDGRDAATFLHASLSNDIQSLEAGRGAYATYLTPQGRIIADFRVFHRGAYLLADVAPGSAAGLAQRLDRLIFAEDVRIADVSGSVSQAAVIGARAPEVLARVFDLDAASLTALGLWSQVVAGDAVVVRTDDAELPSFDVFMPASAYEEFAARVGAAGAVVMSHEMGELLRIEAGHPAFGVDMTEETIPLEAGLLDRAISTTKGCYVGQEIIIRVLHRGGGRVARRLVKLEFDPAVPRLPAAGTPLVADGRETGRVTSAAWSPRDGRVVALGYVHRDLADTRGRVAARVDDRELGASIVGLAG